ncbi:hypothetical protein [Celeribacter sp.]|uniref:hypothetical protein n=1 Tax=Celeribacter sp. TaxID=1890673 RepID=UPI003A955E23
MNFSKTSVALASAVFFSALATGASAQQDIASACTAQPASCEAIMLAEIARLESLGLAGAALDEQIASLVSQVYVAAQATTAPEVLRAISSAMESAASSMSNPQAAQGVIQAAAVVESGQAAATPAEAVGLDPTPAASTPATDGQPASDA